METNNNKPTATLKHRMNFSEAEMQRGREKPAWIQVHKLAESWILAHSG